VAGKSKDTASALKVEALPFVSVILLKALSGPDDELGKLLLGLFIQTKAQEFGIPANEIPEDFAERVVERVKTSEVDKAKNAAWQMAAHLAAAGDFEKAGRFFRESLAGGTISIVNENRARRHVRKVQQDREFRKLGKEARQRQGQETKKRVFEAVEDLFKAWPNPKKPTGRQLARRVAQETGIPEPTVRPHLPEKTVESLWAAAKQHKMDQTGGSDPL
jgi:hypothetical protein